jgi:hypothetical protein
MNIRKGDKIIINKDKVAKYLGFNKKLPLWYSSDIYTITNIENKYVTLNKDLPNGTGNKIHIEFIRLLKSERKKKLLKLLKL